MKVEYYTSPGGCKYIKKKKKTSNTIQKGSSSVTNSTVGTFIFRLQRRIKAEAVTTRQHIQHLLTIEESVEDELEMKQHLTVTQLGLEKLLKKLINFLVVISKLVEETPINLLGKPLKINGNFI